MYMYMYTTGTESQADAQNNQFINMSIALDWHLLAPGYMYMYVEAIMTKRIPAPLHLYLLSNAS